MEIRINFLKPFRYLSEAESSASYIISIRKSPLFLEEKDMGEGYYKTIVAIWSYTLYLNLFLLMIKIKWTSKQK